MQVRIAHRVGVTVALALCALAGCAPEPVPAPAPTPVAPTTPTPLSPEQRRLERATGLVDAWTPRERAASVVMSTISTTDPAALAAFVHGQGLGGVILMSGNIPPDPVSLAALTGALTPDAAFPPLIAIDQEGGVVSRLAWDPFPGADSLKHTGPADTRAAFAGRAALLAEAGVNVNFGVVADVTPDTASFIYPRALGADVDSAAQRVAAAVAGERGIVASTLKHFPGHGAAAGDSHVGIPTTGLSREEWEASHRVPFAAGIDAGAELIMFGHLAFSAVDPAPASLSPVWHDIARGDLGFAGVIVSDDLGMLLDSGLPEYTDLAATTVAALAAGTDLALIVRGADEASVPAVIDTITAAVESGVLPAGRLREAAIRVAALRLELGEDASEPEGAPAADAADADPHVS